MTTFRLLFQFIRRIIAAAASRSADIPRVAALAIVLALGMTMTVVAAQSVRAQSPLDDCSSGNSGNTCMEGEFCLFFVCWDFETFWPGEGDEEPDPGCSGTDRYGLPCGGGSVWD